MSKQDYARCADELNNSEGNFSENQQQPSVLISSFAEATAFMSCDPSRRDNDSTSQGSHCQALETQGLSSSALGIQAPQNKTTSSQMEHEQDASEKSQSRTKSNIVDDVMSPECFDKINSNLEQSKTVRRRLPQSSSQVQSSSNSSLCNDQSTNRTGDQTSICNDRICDEASGLSPSTSIQAVERQGQRLHAERSEVDDSLDLLPSSQKTSREDYAENVSLSAPVEVQSAEVDDRIQILGNSFDGENSASWEEFFEEIMEEIQDSRASSNSPPHNGDSSEENVELEDEEQGSDISPNRLPARERAALRRARNRRKKERRKQRRKERWMEVQDGKIEEQVSCLYNLCLAFLSGGYLNTSVIHMRDQGNTEKGLVFFLRLNMICMESRLGFKTYLFSRKRVLFLHY